MPLNSNYSTSPVTASSATAEVAAIASPALSPFAASTTQAPGAYQGYTIRGVANVTLGTGATSVVARVRAGATTAATLVGQPWTITTVALTTVQVPIMTIDQGSVPTSQYCITVATPGGSGNVFAVVNSAYIETDIAT